MLFKKKENTPVDPTVSELNEIDQEFERDVRITEARPFIIKAFFWIWAVLDILLIVAAILGITLYLVNGSFTDRRLTVRFGQNTEQQRASSLDQQAVALVVEDDPRVFSLGDNQYDILSIVENPNEQWVAQVDYRFDVGGAQTETERVVIGPGAEMPLAVIGAEFESGAGTARLEITRIKWLRPDLLTIDSTVAGQSLVEFYEERSNFIVTNGRHGRGVALPSAATEETEAESEDSEEPQDSTTAVLPTSGTSIQTVATITNQTPYSYWDADFYVVIERAGVPVGVNRLTMKGFESGESRDVLVRWFSEAPTTGDPVFYPIVNVFDKDVYLLPDSEPEMERFF